MLPTSAPDHYRAYSTRHAHRGRGTGVRRPEGLAGQAIVISAPSAASSLIQRSPDHAFSGQSTKWDHKIPAKPPLQSANRNSRGQKPFQQEEDQSSCCARSNPVLLFFFRPPSRSTALFMARHQAGAKCPLFALSGHRCLRCTCPLPEVKRTSSAKFA